MVICNKKGINMTLFKRFKRKQNKQQVSKYPLPDEYRGPNKILGKDVFVPLPPDKNGNVLILGSAGSGTIPSYVEPNIANTAARISINLAKPL